MKKLCLLLPGRRTYIFWSSDFLIFITFKRLLSTFLWKNLQVSKYILKVLIKFYCFTNIYHLKFLDNEATVPWNFYEICTEEAFASYILSNEGSIKASILLILLKYIVVGYSNGNESFTGRLFSNYRPLNMLFHFFNLSFIVFFTRVLSKSLWNYPFSAQISKSISRYSILQKIRVSNFVILKWRPCFWGCFLRNKKMLTFWIFMNQIFW